MQASPAAISPARKPLAASLWFQVLIVLSIIGITILLRGYKCFRSDHLTQIPLFFIQNDPSLFRNDWFLTSFGHFKERFYPLLILHAGHFLFQNLAAGIFFFYVLFVGATILAWLKISLHAFGSIAPGIVAAILAMVHYEEEIGSNHVLEDILIPRTEAFAFVYWGLYFLLTKRYLRAGVMVALGAYFQLAVGLLFGIPMAIFLLIPHPWQSLRGAAKFGIAFLAIMVPESIRWLVGAGLLETASVPTAEQIQLAAYVRHPHHMIPSLWGFKWFGFLAVLSLSALSWARSYRQHRESGALGYLALCICVILAIATIFIELVPIKSIIELQPYRMAVLLYFLLYMLLGSRAIALLKEESFARNCRGMALVLGMYEWRMLACLSILEMMHLYWEKQGRSTSEKKERILFLIAIIIAMVVDDDVWRFVTIILPCSWLYGKWRKPFFGLPGKWKLAGLVGAISACFLFFASFFMLPYHRWVEHGNTETRKRAAELAWKYQINPVPIKDIERIGAWAKEHTEKDALFMFPPERTSEGFGLWAQRASFFSMKFFPYNPKGLAQWKERYFAVRGVPEGNSEVARLKREIALHDLGGEGVNEDYRLLTEEQILQMSRKYRIDYIITPTEYNASFLKRVFEGYDADRRFRPQKALNLYRIDSTK